MALRYVLLFFCLLSGAQWSTAQRVLLVERLNSAQTEKLFSGNYIQYRLVGEEGWRESEIYDLREDQQLIVLADRYLKLDEIERMRFRRPWATALGAVFLTFGVSWSGFAAIGYSVDGDPETNYGRGDAIVTGASLGLGLIMLKLSNRNVRFGKGKRNRLRIVDISF